jgi:hypothetical protein
MEYGDTYSLLCLRCQQREEFNIIYLPYFIVHDFLMTEASELHSLNYLLKASSKSTVEKCLSIVFSSRIDTPEVSKNNFFRNTYFYVC